MIWKKRISYDYFSWEFSEVNIRNKKNKYKKSSENEIT